MKSKKEETGLENFRFEFKYQITPEMADSIRKDLEKYGVGLDPFSQAMGGDHYYIVSSIYFDTPFLDDYYAKAGGFLERRKIRGRFYTDQVGEKTDFIWLEQKKKHDMMIDKTRIKLTKEEWKDFLLHGASSLINKTRDNPKEKEIVKVFLEESRKPSVFVRYKRMAYIYKFYSRTPIRITFDKEILASPPCIKGDFGYTGFMFPVLSGRVVMEIKFNKALPWWFEGIVKHYGISRDACSKYALSIQAINRSNNLPR